MLCSKNDITADSYLIPHATMELGLNFMRLGNFVEARKCMDECKTYTSYALETIVHFRIHTALRTMSLVSKQQKRQTQQQLECINEEEDDLKKTDSASNGSGFGFGIWNALSRRLIGDKTTCTEELRKVTDESAESL